MPIAVQREDAVDVEPRRRRRRGSEPLSPRAGERGAELVEAGAGLRAHGDDRRARHELVRLGERQLERLLVDRVRLRHRDDAALDAEQSQDREMLVRLRPRAFGRVDHEQEEVDPGRARDHRAHEPLVARDVDEREPACRPAARAARSRASIEIPRSRSSGSRSVSLPGQRPHEPRLAVVDVARGPDRERHQRAARTAAATSSTSSSSRVRQSSSSRPSRTIPTTGGVTCPKRSDERLLDRAREARQLRERQRAAADAGDGLLDRLRRQPRRAASARARTAAAGSRSMRRTGMRSGASRCSCERSFERSERQLVGAQRALQRMSPQSLDEVGATRRRSPPAGRRAACRR